VWSTEPERDGRRRNHLHEPPRSGAARVSISTFIVATVNEAPENEAFNNLLMPERLWGLASRPVAGTFASGLPAVEIPLTVRLCAALFSRFLNGVRRFDSCRGHHPFVQRKQRYPVSMLVYEH
jgi:hypothetical protein